MLRPILLFAAMACAYSAPRLNLMPLPWTVAVTSGQLRIDSTFQISAAGTADPLLQAAIDRLQARIVRQIGLSAVHPPSHITLSVECSNPAAALSTLGEDESYQLDVSSS